MTNFTRLSFVLAAVAAVSASSLACSGAGGGGEKETLPENTGAIVAQLTNVPGDVQCVELRTSDYRTPYVRQDVTPGGSATIRLAPLSPGYLYLSGQAFDHACDVWSIGDAGAASDVTWEATPTYVTVTPGQVTQAELHFHQFGALDVNVSFDNGQCDADASFGYGCATDAGPTQDATQPVFDAGFTSSK